MRNKFLFLILTTALLNGCAGSPLAIMWAIESATSSYQEVSRTIKLGDSADDVIAKLDRAMDTMPASYRKSSDQYIENNIKVQIYYARSGWTSDDLTTDDEFTPYIFKNGVLVAIGWKAIGGPKTRGGGHDIQMRLEQEITNKKK